MLSTQQSKNSQMSGTQSKLLCMEKNQENTTYDEREKINLESTQPIELASEDIKTSTITIFHIFK